MDKRQSSHCPRKPNPRKQLLHHSRENHPAGRRPRSRKTNRQTPLLAEVRTQQTQTRTEETAISETAADALGEEELPVGGREGSHEEAEDANEGADEEHGTEMACVGEAASEGADEEEEKDLDAANPGDVGGGAAECGYVVGLEDTE